MNLACLVYLAKLQTKTDVVQLHQHKDLNTRLYARERISGVLMVAGGFLFEIMEGDYASLESNLDRVSGTSIMDDPEVMIFSSLKERQFQNWKMGIIETEQPESHDIEVFRMLGEQTQSDAISTPNAVMHMLKHFHDQFVKSDPFSDAA